MFYFPQGAAHWKANIWPFLEPNKASTRRAGGIELSPERGCIFPTRSRNLAHNRL